MIVELQQQVNGGGGGADDAAVILAPSEIAAVSWTGGKDCNLALLAAWRDPSLLVTSLVCFKFGSSHRAHPIAFMEAQATALGLPLLFVTIATNNEKTTLTYKQAYVEGMRRLRLDHGITVMVTGDMDLVGTMERNWIEECGEEAGIRAYLPLWGADREECLQNLIDDRFEVVFSCVKSPFFDGSWIGRKLNADTLVVLKAMSQEEVPAGSDHQALDLGGERGEYHTMCLNGPLYSSRVAIEILPDPLLQVIDPVVRKEKGWDGNIHFTRRMWTIAIQEREQIPPTY
jgi:diphthine-ammonia ligase